MNAVGAPLTWRGGNIMPFIITDGEDDVGKDPTLYGNMPPANGPRSSTTESPTVNCTGDVRRAARRHCDVLDADVPSRQAREQRSGGIHHQRERRYARGVRDIAGTTPPPPRSSTWTATATIPTTRDGEVPLRICEPVVRVHADHRRTPPWSCSAPTPRRLIDGTSPVLQLVDFISESDDDKIAKAGDVVRLYFEASEMVTRLTMTIDGNTRTAVAVDASGLARRRFPTPLLAWRRRCGRPSSPIAWEVDYTVASSTPAGEMT